ncbi:MAG TPA: glycosyltransferase [Nitrospiria bacterium]|jgi:UDP-N-acetylglucosamine transferase subunit ALG13|nr:glycosyltransferase [Nitrospiria bacterium]
MILVTAGNATQGFRRLFEAVDKLSSEGAFGDDVVIIQSGNDSSFRASQCKQVDFFPLEQFPHAVRDADLIICHGGAGTLHHCFAAGKVPVVMPRRVKYGEILDDNQIGLVKALAAEGRVIPAYEAEDLPAAIAEARWRNKQPVPPPPSRMLELVARAIEELTNQKQ